MNARAGRSSFGRAAPRCVRPWGAPDVGRRERAIGRGLAVWAACSVLGGAALVAGGRTAAGRQHLVWGAVDGVIAARSARTVPPDRDPGARARRLRRLLLANAALDTGYVAVGAALRSGRLPVGRLRSRAEQDGTAVMVQGAFLLGFDLWHAARLRRPPRP